MVQERQVLDIHINATMVGVLGLVPYHTIWYHVLSLLLLVLVLTVELRSTIPTPERSKLDFDIALQTVKTPAPW